MGESNRQAQSSQHGKGSESDISAQQIRSGSQPPPPRGCLIGDSSEVPMSACGSEGTDGPSSAAAAVHLSPGTPIMIKEHPQVESVAIQTSGCARTEQLHDATAKG